MSDLIRKPYTFDSVTRIIFTIVVVAGAIYLINLLKGALLPFLVAWLLAYLINPIVLFCQNKLRIRNRLLAIFTTLISIIVIITALGFTFIPSIVKEVEETSRVIENLQLNNTTETITQQSWYKSLLDRVDFEELANKIQPEEWKKIAENAIPNLWSILTSSINHVLSIVGWFIVVLYLVFILLDYEKIINGFKKLIPQKYREITLSILIDVEEGMSRYFRGQSLIALLVGIGFSIGFVIIGLPLAIPLGLFIGLLNLVPYLQIIGIIPTILLCWLGSYNGHGSFWVLLSLSLVVFAVVQFIQDAIITPRIMGHVTGLNPAVILLSLSIWGTLMGIMGMIIALPLTSLLLAYYKRYILKDKDITTEITEKLEE